MSLADRSQTLIVFAHPALERARINQALIRVAEEAPRTDLCDLYEIYPDFAIDVVEEQRRLTAADVVILQFPLYWYSSPALMKEWMDLVLEHGFSYGEAGRALEGKTLACAVSTGGREQAYSAEGHNRFTLAEFLRPFEQTAHLCRMRWAEPFAVHGAAICGEVRLGEEMGRYRAWLDALAGPASRDAA